LKHEVRLSADMKTMTLLYTGTVTGRDVELAQKARVKDLEIFKQLEILVHDYTDADISPLRKEKLYELTDINRSAAELNPDLAIILIIADDLAFRVCRTAQAYSEDIPWTSHLVHSRDESEKLIKKLTRKK
jgi:hypothetical protein